MKRTHHGALALKMLVAQGKLSSQIPFVLVIRIIIAVLRMGIIGLLIPHNAFVRVANIAVRVKRGKQTTYALLATQMMNVVQMIIGELTITAHAILY